MPSPSDDAPEMETFHATGMLSKYGFNDGGEPDDVLDLRLDRHGVEGLEDDTVDWHEDVLVPIARDLLAPALPVPVVFEAVNTSHNPARVTEIDGRPYDATSAEPDGPNYWYTFNKVHISIPVDYLADVLDGTRDFTGLDRLTGIDLALLTDAFAIGMSVDEIATAHADGALAGASTLRALRP